MKTRQMSPFPGRIRKGKDGFYYLNARQKAWLIKYYPTHLRKELLEAMGICRETFTRLIKQIIPPLKKDEDWKYYQRCLQIRENGDQGCAVIHRLTEQKRQTITVATKLSWYDYIRIRDEAKKQKKTLYKYLQGIILKSIREL